VVVEVYGISSPRQVGYTEAVTQTHVWVKGRYIPGITDIVPVGFKSTTY